MNIAEKYKNKVTIQSYEPKTVIAGVEIIKGEYFQDDGGNFAEIARLDEKGFMENLASPFQVRQLSMSVLVPGTVKAYHLHYEQDDVWYVPPSERLLVNLHDVREDSSSFDSHMRIVMGAGQHMLLRIPRGVAHGVANCYNRDMCLLYATDAQFNPEHPDERRLAWDTFGTECWELHKG